MDLVIQIHLRRVPELWSIVPSEPPHQVLRRQRTISNHFLQFSSLLGYFVRGSLAYSLSIADFTAMSALVANLIWAVSRLRRISSRRSRSEANSIILRAITTRSITNFEGSFTELSWTSPMGLGSFKKTWLCRECQTYWRLFSLPGHKILLQILSVRGRLDIIMVRHRRPRMGWLRSARGMSVNPNGWWGWG